MIDEKLIAISSSNELSLNRTLLQNRGAFTISTIFSRKLLSLLINDLSISYFVILD